MPNQPSSAIALRNAQPADGSPNGGRNESLRHRFGDYVHNEHRADMMFHVTLDDTLIPAHRFIVGTASPVLHGLIYGTDNGAAPVTVPDCTAPEFKEILRYLYTDEIGPLNLTNAISIMLLARFYRLPILEQKCSDLLLEQLKFETACRIFDRVHVLDNDIGRHCLHMIQDYASWVFECSEGMNPFDMDVDALRKVLETEFSIISEVGLFELLIRWAKAKWAANGCSATTSLRTIVAGRLRLIRITAMTIEQFRKCMRCAGSDFFDQAEIDAILAHIDCPNATPDIAHDLPVYASPRLTYRSYRITQDVSVVGHSGSRIVFACIRAFRLNGFLMCCDMDPVHIFMQNPPGPASKYEQIEYLMKGLQLTFTEPIAWIEGATMSIVFKYDRPVEMRKIGMPFNVCGTMPFNLHNNVDMTEDLLVPFTHVNFAY